MSSTPDTTRVSDDDRDRVAGHLRAAVGRGQLTLAEVDERLRAAYAAVTRAELAAVTADLPQPIIAPTRPRPAAARVDWTPWLGGTLLMIGIWAVTSLAAGHALFFWPIFPVLAWGLSVGACAMGLKPAGHRGAALRHR